MPELHVQAPTRLPVVAIALLLIVMAGFYLLNHLVPTFADDLCRRSPEFSLQEIINDVYQMYFNWTGRSPVMLLNRLVFSSGETGILFFNLANSMMLGIACCYVLRYATIGHPGQLSPGLVVTTLTVFLWLLWFTPEVFAEALLWKTGAIQYFWACIITLVALHPLIGELRSGIRPAYAPVYFAICWLGGTWLENLSLAVIPVWLVLLVLIRRNALTNTPVLKQAATGLVVWCLGALFLFAAPGNYVRANAMHSGYHWAEQILATGSRLVEIIDPLILVVYLLFLALLYYHRPADWQPRVQRSIVFLSVALMSTLVMAGAPTDAFVRRVGFPTEFFLIIAALCLFPRELFIPSETTALKLQRRILQLTALFLMGGLFFDALIVHHNYRSIWQQQQLRERWILTARSAHLPVVEFLPLYFDDGRSTLNGQVNDGRYFARDITTDQQHWKNKCFAQAYELPAVILREK